MTSLIDQLNKALPNLPAIDPQRDAEFEANKKKILDSPDVPAPGLQPINPAAERCERAAKRACKTAVAAGKNRFEVEIAAQEAFLKAMPLPDSFENIRDFVACITYGMLTDRISYPASDKLLQAAKVAAGIILRKSSASKDSPAPKEKMKTFAP